MLGFEMLPISISAKSVWTAMSKAALIVELIASYVLAFGIWILVFKFGRGTNSRYLDVAVYITIGHICVCTWNYIMILMFLLSRKLCVLEILFLSTNPRKDESSSPRQAEILMEKILMLSKNG